MLRKKEKKEDDDEEEEEEEENERKGGREREKSHGGAGCQYSITSILPLRLSPLHPMQITPSLILRSCMHFFPMRGVACFLLLRLHTINGGDIVAMLRSQ